METQEGTGMSLGTSELSESPELTVSNDAPETSPGPAESAGENPAEQSGINPAWVGLRDAIGEDHFETFARPILSEMDQSAQQRITNLNSQLKEYEGFQPFVEQGLTAEHLQQAVQVAELLENSPEQLYEFLSEHLGKNAAEAEEEPESYDEESFDVNTLPPEIQQQFEQMQQFQQQMQEQQEQQEFERQVAEFEAQIEREGQEFIQNNPSWTAEDLPELDEIRMQLTEQLAQQGHKRFASYDEAAKVLQQRISRYTQRSAAAPKTLPTTAGGNITTPESFDPKKASRKDFDAQVAADLMSLKASE